MKKLKTVFALKKHELIIWLLSVAAIIAAFIFGGNFDAMTLAASITGATALIYVAKGNFIGQLLTVVFAVLYSIISWRLRYYGEMLTYLGMTAPIAALALISWIKNPFGNDKTEVRVANLNLKKWLILAALTAAVTAAFYFILKALNTANLTVSTISVATSFIAASYVFKKRILRPGICGQRRRSDNFMDYGRTERTRLLHYGNVFFNLFYQRYIRLSELA